MVQTLERATRREPETRGPDPASVAYRQAFDRWLRGGPQPTCAPFRAHLDLSEAEARALSTAVMTTAGFLVSEEFAIAAALASNIAAPLRSLATVVPTRSGGDLITPSADDTSTEAQILVENEQADITDVAVGRLAVPSFQFVTGITCSWQFIADAADGFMGWLADRLAGRVARRLNRAAATGVAGSEPQGIVWASTLGVTGLAVSSISGGEIQSLEDSLDPAYRHALATRYVMASATLTHCKRLQSDSGLPLWQPDPTGREPAGLLNGIPVLVTKDIPALGAGNRSVLLGDLSQLVIRDVEGAVLLQDRESVARSAQTRFFYAARHGAQLMNAGVAPIVAFQHAAA